MVSVVCAAIMATAIMCMPLMNWAYSWAVYGGWNAHVCWAHLYPVKTTVGMLYYMLLGAAACFKLVDYKFGN